MRNMSFALTERQFLDGSKTVTRRLGWQFLQPGDRLRAVRKGMGLKKGEKVHVLGVIEVVSIWGERLSRITAVDCDKEGFPRLLPRQFVSMFCREMQCDPEIIVNRIEFRKLNSRG